MESNERVDKIRERAKNLKFQRSKEDLLASTDVERAYENTINDLIGDIEYLLDSQAAEDDLKSRDDVLAFFGASLKEDGNLHIDMKKYHAAHLCQEHSFQPWRRNEIEEKCVMCIARDRDNSITVVCNHLKTTADKLVVRQETECPSGTAFKSEAALRRRIATELESLTFQASTTKPKES